MQLNPADFITTTFNTGGAWFPTNTGVRITYMPTQKYEECSTHRSQHGNRNEAWQNLIARLNASNEQLELDF